MGRGKQRHRCRRRKAPVVGPLTLRKHLSEQEQIDIIDCFLLRLDSIEAKGGQHPQHYYIGEALETIDPESEGEGEGEQPLSTDQPGDDLSSFSPSHLLPVVDLGQPPVAMQLQQCAEDTKAKVVDLCFAPESGNEGHPYQQLRDQFPNDASEFDLLISPHSRLSPVVDDLGQPPVATQLQQGAEEPKATVVDPFAPESGKEGHPDQQQCDQVPDDVSDLSTEPDCAEEPSESEFGSVPLGDLEHSSSSGDYDDPFEVRSMIRARFMRTAHDAGISAEVATSWLQQLEPGLWG